MNTQPPKVVMNAEGSAEVQDGPLLVQVIIMPEGRREILPLYPMPSVNGEAKMSNTNDIFDTFIKAKEALDRLPAAEAQVAHLQHSLDICQGNVTARDEQIADQAQQINDLRDRLTQVRTQLDESTFRELQSRESLDAVLKVLKTAASSSAVAEADELLNPLPVQPTTGPEPSTGEVGASVSSSEQSTQGSGQSSESGSGIEGQSEEGFTNSTTTIGTPTPMSNTTMSISMNEAQSGSPFVPSTAEESPPAMQSDGSTTSSLDTACGSNAPSPADVSRPNEGRPYWEKPRDMTWHDWTATGGEDSPF